MKKAIFNVAWYLGCAIGFFKKCYRRLVPREDPESIYYHPDGKGY